MVDVTDGADVEMRLVPLKLCLRHDILPSLVWFRIRYGAAPDAAL